jgi:hypothetical protein
MNKFKNLNTTFDITNKKSHVPTMEFISPVNKKHNKRLIIMIRGHIRDSFSDTRLRNLILVLSRKYNTTIYLHTWNILQGNKSWREIEKDETIVTEDMILSYFDMIPIKEIKIENEDENNLIGNIEGNISNTLCPIICWKNMWYGMYQIIKNIDDPVETTILNIRYDIFTNKNRLFTIQSIVNTVDSNFNKYMYSNAFISKNEPTIGIDNMIIGSLYSMRNLIQHFYYNLDEILARYPDEIHQEYIVFKENGLLIL